MARDDDANKRVKFGTTVSGRTDSAIASFRSAWPGLYKTPGSVVDELAGAFLNVPGNVARTIVATCDRELDACGKRIEALTKAGAGELQLSETRATQAGYRRMRTHFARFLPDGAAASGDAPMRRIDLSDGSFAIVPEDWVVLNAEGAGSGSHALCVETVTRDGKTAPHFVYLSEIGIKDFDRRVAVHAAERVWPKIAEVVRGSVEPVFGSDGTMLNMAEVLAAPHVDVYELRESASFDAWERPPYGAMVFRADGPKAG